MGPSTERTPSSDSNTVWPWGYRHGYVYGWGWTSAGSFRYYRCHTVGADTLQPEITFNIDVPINIQESDAYFIKLHDKVLASGLPNFLGIRNPVPSTMNIHLWRSNLEDYHDNIVADFLEFGWPIGYTSPDLPTDNRKNHIHRVLRVTPVTSHPAETLVTSCNMTLTCQTACIYEIYIKFHYPACENM